MDSGFIAPSPSGLRRMPRNDGAPHPFAIGTMDAHTIIVVASYFGDSGIQNNLDFRSSAFLQEHSHNIGSRAIAKKLPSSCAGIGLPAGTLSSP